MSPTRKLLIVAVGALTLVACGDDATGDSNASPTTEAMTDTTDAMVDTTDAMTDTTDAMTDDSMLEEMAEMAAWQQLTLTDTDGASFTLGDFMGKPVFVEHFATWCPNCREQLGKTDAAAAELGDDAVFIALSVETELSADDIADYAADNGFTNVRFAVMTPEFLAAISDAFGNSSINPPSTPHYIIDNHGVAGGLATGFEDADAIVEALHTAAM